MKFRREYAFLPMADLPNVRIAANIPYDTQGNRIQQTALTGGQRLGNP
jgi:hypothetical protein